MSEEIRRLEPSDLPFAAEAEESCFALPWSEESIEELRQSRPGYLLVAERDGVPAGYLFARIVLDEGELLRLGVLPGERGRGLGSRLVNRMLSDHPGVITWRLDVREHNLPAIRCYERAGFRKLCLNKDYYSEPKENGFLMIREAF